MSSTGLFFGKDGRATVRLFTGWQSLSRVIWVQAYGPIPPGHVVHHINGDASDERLENLLALPTEEHRRYHNLKDRQAAEDIHTKWLSYWANYPR